MVRTQVYLAAADHRALKTEARRLRISMTELMRRIVSLHVSGRVGVAAHPKEAILSFVGLGRSGSSSGAERHDEALDEAFRDERLR